MYVGYALQDADKDRRRPRRRQRPHRRVRPQGQLRDAGSIFFGDILNAPWGMAPGARELRPPQTASMLIVGNFGDGTLLRGRPPVSGRSVGQAARRPGRPRALVIPGLWALVFGNGRRWAQDELKLYFTAGGAPTSRTACSGPSPPRPERGLDRPVGRRGRLAARPTRPAQARCEENRRADEPGRPWCEENRRADEPGRHRSARPRGTQDRHQRLRQASGVEEVDDEGDASDAGPFDREGV